MAGAHEAMSVFGAPPLVVHLRVLLAGSAAGTVLGQVPGGGPASATATSVPGPVLPSATKGEMLVRCSEPA